MEPSSVRGSAAGPSGTGSDRVGVRPVAGGRRLSASPTGRRRAAGRPGSGCGSGAAVRRGGAVAGGRRRAVRAAVGAAGVATAVAAVRCSVSPRVPGSVPGRWSGDRARSPAVGAVGHRGVVAVERRRAMIAQHQVDVLLAVVVAVDRGPLAGVRRTGRRRRSRGRPRVGQRRVVDVLRVARAVAVGVHADDRPGRRDELHRADRAVEGRVVVVLAGVGVGDLGGAAACRRARMPKMPGVATPSSPSTLPP